ncbi:helix-turn-helix transcriptional regulator [Ponticaulis profundi]|uniref:Helix-turn-helix transcriptional regulator n=1 Tax=Ponticaulis profundi TaxID=2665222 RepID=A0ABW1SBH7_9PROT
MRRTERLFQIIQILRRNRRPVTARTLSDELETSVRTIYRDMAELLAQGVPIRGEAGTGYVLEPGFDMPPLMLTEDELEAAVLGARWVAARGDQTLARAALDLIAKLTTSVPLELQPIIVDAGLEPISFRNRLRDSADMSVVRQAIRTQSKLQLDYCDETQNVTQRTIWPFLIAYAEEVRLICAWCELRNDFRSFRTDRVRDVSLSSDRFRPRVLQLRRQWEAQRRACRAGEG